ncbi:MAG: PAS domain S-box protein [Pyrinomonadaceae bacterium]
MNFNNMSRNGQLQAELLASEMRYRRLFESARDGILVLDAVNQKITDTNPLMVELLGSSRDEILGKELWEIGLFKNKDESRDAFRELLEKGSLHYKDLPLETKAGKLREVEFISNVYLEGMCQVIQCNIRDITERKLAEEARDQLTQNAAQLAQIAGKAARLGGWTIQLPERTLIWSDENCAIHDLPPGYKPTLEEGIGYFPPEYRDQVIRYVEACAQDGTPYDFELPKYTARGRLIWVRSIGEAMRDNEGRIIGIQGAFQDITVRKQVEAEKEKLINELQNALAEVKTLREFLPICSYCKKVRDDENYWSQMESYLSKHTHTKFSHGICPECYEMEVTPQLEKRSSERLLISKR